MEEEKSKHSDKKKRDKLDRELDQTFPASDPPSHTRPGEDRIKEKKVTGDKTRLKF